MKKLGILFILLACMSWISIIVLPFLSFSLSMKATLIAGAVVLGEVFFWIGTILLGKEVISKYKSYLRGKKTVK